MHCGIAILLLIGVGCIAWLFAVWNIVPSDCLTSHPFRAWQQSYVAAALPSCSRSSLMCSVPVLTSTHVQGMSSLRCRSGWVARFIGRPRSVRLPCRCRSVRQACLCHLASRSFLGGFRPARRLEDDRHGQVRCCSASVAGSWGRSVVQAVLLAAI